MLLPSRASIAVGFQTLRANPLRTMLSTLGVVMGIASLVAVLAVGDGVERYAREELSRTTDLQTIAVSARTHETIDGVRLPRERWPQFDLATLASLRAQVGERGTASISLTGSSLVEAAGARRAAVVTGTVPEGMAQLREELLAGRVFTDAEAGQSVAVVSLGLARTVAEGGDDAAVARAALGRRVVLQGAPFEVIGVVRATRGRERRLAAAVPFAAAARALAPTTEPRAPMLVVRARTVEEVAALKRDVERWRDAELGGPDAAEVQASAAARIEQATKGVLVFKILMGAFAGISLLVGGIGIMNVLIAAVAERTREIGVRKAVGARQRDILTQFLSESVAICAAGAVLGMALGFAGAFGVTALMRAKAGVQLHAAFAWPSLLVAALAAVLVGLASGTFPAFRAARLSPIEAIRHE